MASLNERTLRRAIDAKRLRAHRIGRLIRIEVIAQPHPDLPRHLLGAEHTGVRGPRT